MRDSLAIHKQRNSSIELLRILAMIGIVFTHLAGNSNISLADDSVNRFAFELFKFGGGIGNNLFILISGYFMVHSSFKSSKVIRLILELTFYSAGLYLISCLLGAANFGIKHLIQSFVPMISGGGYWFAVAYTVLFMLSPVLNKGILNASKKQLQLLLAVMLFILSFLPSVVNQFISVNDFWSSNLSWMITMYIMGAYLRLYPIEKFKSKKLSISLFVSFFLLIVACRVLYTSSYSEGLNKYFRVIIKIFSSLQMYNSPGLIASILLFLIFVNINMKYNKFINLLGSTTFGIYLIHNNIWFKKFMWVSVFKVCNYQSEPYFVPYCFGVVIAIMILGGLIDFIRKKVLEDPIMKIPFLSAICTQFDSKISK